MFRNTRIGRRPRAIENPWMPREFLFFFLIRTLFAVVSESAAAGTGDTLAVVPFRVYGEVPHPEMVSHGLPELISGHLSKVPGITVVDRIHLSEVIQELKLGQTGLVDEKTAAKTGTLLPANLVLAGTAQCSGKDIQIQIQAVRTSTGKIAFGVEAEGKIGRASCRERV